MITEINKNLWDFDVEQYYRVITTNGNIKLNGDAVMGRGIALQAAERYPQLPSKLAERLKLYGNKVNVFPEHKIITFPTKNNWRDNSTYELIESSCNNLVVICNYINIKKIVMPMVGCSNGGLKWTNVRKIIYKKFENSDIDVTIARI